MFGLGSRELIMLALILVLLFGAKKITDLARAISDSARIIRKGFSDEDKDKTDKTDRIA